MSATSNIIRMVRFLSLITQMRRTKEELISIMYEQHKYVIADRTFDRMLRDLRNIGYEIAVDSRYRYLIKKDDQDIDCEVILQLNSLLSRKELLSRLGYEIESNFIIQNFIDEGIANITIVIEAINQQRDLVFDYTNRESHKTFERRVIPLRLMEAEYRWYLISYEYNKDLKVFSLDRMSSIFMSDKFSKKDISNDVAKRVLSYENRIGVNKPLFDDDPYMVFKVEIGVTETFRPFLKQMPIHFSQKFTGKKFGDYYIFTIDVIPDYTLLKKISSELGDMKLIGPTEIKERILQEYPWFSSFVL